PGVAPHDEVADVMTEVQPEDPGVEDDVGERVVARLVQADAEAGGRRLKRKLVVKRVALPTLVVPFTHDSHVRAEQSNRTQTKHEPYTDEPAPSALPGVPGEDWQYQQRV